MCTGLLWLLPGPLLSSNCVDAGLNLAQCNLCQKLLVGSSHVWLHDCDAPFVLKGACLAASVVKRKCVFCGRFASPANPDGHKCRHFQKRVVDASGVVGLPGLATLPIDAQTCDDELLHLASQGMPFLREPGWLCVSVLQLDPAKPQNTLFTHFVLGKSSMSVPQADGTREHLSGVFPIGLPQDIPYVGLPESAQGREEREQEEAEAERAGKGSSITALARVQKRNTRDGIVSVQPAEVGSMAVMLNGSCTPNAEPLEVKYQLAGTHEQRVMIILRPNGKWKPGDELTWDYSATTDTPSEAMMCCCTPDCPNWLVKYEPVRRR